MLKVDVLAQPALPAVEATAQAALRQPRRPHAAEVHAACEEQAAVAPRHGMRDRLPRLVAVAQASEHRLPQLQCARVLGLPCEAILGGGDQPHAGDAALLRQQPPPQHAGRAALQVSGRGGRLTADDRAPG
jgi:hypothetical protein